MSQFFQYLAHNFHIVVILIAVFGSAAQAILKKLNEKAKEQRLEAARRRAEFEALRTGRVQPAPAAPAAPVLDQEEARRRMQEIARKRREEIETARRRQAAQAQVAQAQSRPTFAPSAPPRAPVPPTPRTAARPGARRDDTGRRRPAAASGTDKKPNPRPAQPTEVAGRRTAEGEAARERVDRTRRDREISDRDLLRDHAEALAVHSGSPGSAVVPRPAGAAPRLDPFPLRGLSAAEIRRAIVAMEVLGPPVSLRDRQGEVAR